MSEQQPEELRRDIARTRADMDQTLAQIEDRVSPSRIKDRQVDRFRGRWERTREKVMGSEGPDVSERAGEVGDEMAHRADQVGERASEAAQHAADRARETPERVEELTRGNPLAVGLVAFGLGALAGSLVPSSGPERQLATGLRNEFEEPVKSELQTAGQEVKDDLQEHAQQAVEETKQTAQQAADRTTEEARGRAEEVRSEAEQAAENVQEQRT
jgi:gas vesicle protein